MFVRWSNWLFEFKTLNCYISMIHNSQLITPDYKTIFFAYLVRFIISIDYILLIHNLILITYYDTVDINFYVLYNNM